MTKKSKDHISVWPFRQAPSDIKELTSQGDDEDWVVFIPKALAVSDNPKPFWIEATDSMREPVQIEVEDGTFFVGCH